MTPENATGLPLVTMAHSLPMLDMALALTAELRAERAVSSVTTIVKFTPVTRAPEIGFLAETAASLSDRVALAGLNPLHEQIRSACRDAGTPVTVLPSTADAPARPRWRRALDRLGGAAAVRALVPGGARVVRSHADADPLAESVGAIARRRGGRVLVSLEGCYPPGEPLPLKYFEAARPAPADAFLYSHASHREQLASVGYAEGEVIGYTKLYPAWLRTLADSPRARAAADTETLTVTLITRGEHPDGGPQIMPHDTLERILADVLAELAALACPVRVLLKPHPAQDLAALGAMLDRARPLRDAPDITITHEYPGVLFAASDLAISTWSTAAIDAMAAGVPVIEYFVENAHFRSIYPGGSSFRSLGIAWCEDRQGFRDALSRVIAGSHRQPAADTALDQRRDLSVFGVTPMGHGSV